MRALRFHILSFVVILLLAMPALGLDSGATNSQEPSDPAARAFLDLQEEIREAKAAIEQNRKASEESATLNAKVADRLQVLEKSLADQRVRDLQAAQSSHQDLVALLPLFVLLSLVLLLTVYFQWRGMNHLRTISSALVVGEGRGPLRVVNAGTAFGPAEPSNARLEAAMERLEARLQEMEHTVPPNNLPPTTERRLAAGTADAEHSASAPASPLSSSAELGQSLLDQAKYAEAIVCFDQLLNKNPNNAAVLVKKGQALERMYKLKEALVCYNRAMALDSSIKLV